MRYFFFVFLFLLLFLPIQVFGEDSLPSFEQAIAGVNKDRLNAFLAEALALQERANQRKTDPSLGNPCADALRRKESECLVKPDGEVVIARLQVLVTHNRSGHKKVTVQIVGRIRLLLDGTFFFDPQVIPYQDGWSRFGDTTERLSDTGR